LSQKRRERKGKEGRGRKGKGMESKARQGTAHEVYFLPIQVTKCIHILGVKLVNIHRR
jgi:hypothetical protein